MTRTEYLDNVIPHDMWLKEHKEYVKKALEEMRIWFDVDLFISDNKKLASRPVIENILADTYMNYNFDYGEYENNLARLFNLPYETVVSYRTEQFWEDIKYEQIDI